MSLPRPLEVPAAVASAAAVIAGLDDCLRVGFGRLGPDQQQGLQSLIRVSTGTPLEKPIADAVAALGRNEFLDKHFAALAALRAALQGSQYDVLRAHAAEVLGRSAPDSADAAPVAPTKVADGPIAVWQESTRHWLMELALAGFEHLEQPTLAPFIATLEQLQDEPRTARLAALLTGFLNELLHALPIASLPRMPVFRWADLWTRSLLGSLRTPALPTGRKVRGSLALLGADLRHHGFFVSLDVYGLLDEANECQAVRVTQSAYKVDALVGGEIWRCFDESATPLLRALGGQRTLEVDGQRLLSTGDLLWDGTAREGTRFSLMERAAKRLAPGVSDAPCLPSLAAADRHPLHIAELVYLDGYKARNAEGLRLDLGPGGLLDVAVERISPVAEVQAAEIQRSSALVGLLRFDGGRWAVQPLAVAQAGKQGSEQINGSGAYDSLGKKKGDTLEVLRERASRLLRKKS